MWRDFLSYISRRFSRDARARAPYGGSMRKYARFGRELRKLTRQAKICTPPGGEVIAKICVVRSKDLYSARHFSLQTSPHVPCIISSRSLAAAATFNVGNFVAAAVKFGFLLLFLSPPLPATSSSSSSSPSAKICTPHPEIWLLAKICTGNLTGSGLRKYALRQNHTIPV